MSPTILQTGTFAQWLHDLRDHQGKAAIMRRIKRAEMGNLGDIKTVGGGVSEMRIKVGPGYRVYFIHRGHVVIILLCGGDKSTQARDIERAKNLAQEV